MGPSHVTNRFPLKGRSIQVQLVGVTSLLLLLACAVFTAVGYARQKQALLSGIDQKLTTCTRLAKAVPPAGYFDRILRGDNPVAEREFLHIVDRYNRICQDLNLQYLWSCMVIDDEIRFTTATSPSKGVRPGDHASFLEVHRDPRAFNNVFGTMEPDFSSFHNEWGHGRMVLVPYRDRHGRPYCVGASVSIDHVHAQIRQMMQQSVLLGGGILALGLVLAIVTSMSLARPVIYLTRVADGIAHGKLTQTIEIGGSAEIQSLARSLRAMQHAIQRTLRQVQHQREQLEITVRRRTAALERSNRELEQFAYVASHDLREPLRKVKSFAELFAKRYESLVDEQGERYIAFLVGGVQRMQNLIDDLLTYSRVGRVDLATERVDLNQVAREVIETISPAIEEAAAQIRIDPLPTLDANASQLGMVFQNLILNAIKFRRDVAPRVTLRAEKQESEWVLSVQDNGIGMETQYFERVFQIFQRLHGRAEYPGTGIGLAVCKKIVQRHGGRIWVASEPGQGSTFYFTLPERQPQEQQEDDS